MTFKEDFPPGTSCGNPCRWLIYTGDCDSSSALLSLENVLVTGPNVGWGTARYYSATVPVPTCGPVSAKPSAVLEAPRGLRVMNPSRGAVAIEYSLSEPGLVDLRIYDVAGRLLRVIENSTRIAGDHAITWDGRTQRGKLAPPGVYFVRLRSGGSQESRKTVLCR